MPGRTGELRGLTGVDALVAQVIEQLNSRR